MSLLDRATTRSTADATTLPATFAPLGGRYVSSRPRRSGMEGTYVTLGAPTRPTHRGTYVTTPTPAPVSGGRYTFSE